MATDDKDKAPDDDKDKAPKTPKEPTPPDDPWGTGGPLS